MFLDQLKQKTSNMTCLFFVYILQINILHEKKITRSLHVYACNIKENKTLSFKKNQNLIQIITIVIILANIPFPIYI